MAALAVLFGVMAVLAVAAAAVSGSRRVLVVGLLDAVIGLGAFCIWAWSL